LNITLGLIAASLIGTLIYLETSDESAATTTTTTTTVPPTTTTTTTTTTVPPTTTTTTTTTTTVPPSTEAPIEPFFVRVIIVNGSTVGERLEPTVAALRDNGYTDVRGVVGAVQTPRTVVYVIDEGWLAEGEAVAAQLGLGDVDIELYDDAPPVSGVGEAQVMVYLGGG
jgi:hypothetical protein